MFEFEAREVLNNNKFSFEKDWPALGIEAIAHGRFTVAAGWFCRTDEGRAGKCYAAACSTNMTISGKPAQRHKNDI